MIIDFTVKNFLSIKDEQTLSMVSTSTHNNRDFLIEVKNEKFKLTSSTIIYGANASGKSNILNALHAFQWFVSNSGKLDIDDEIPVFRYFRLDKTSKNKTAAFEIEFISNKGIRYRYGFEYNNRRVVKEELFFYPEHRKALLFSRNPDKPIKYGIHFKGEKKIIERLLLPNSLFLSKAANITDSPVHDAYTYIRDNLVTRLGSLFGSRFKETTGLINKNQDNFKQKVLNLLKAADFNIDRIELEKDEKKIPDVSDFPVYMPETVKNKIRNDLSLKERIGHPVFDTTGKKSGIEFFDLENDESIGTIKMYELAAPLIHALSNGTVLFIDEIERSLHPEICKLIVELFRNRDMNRNGAQLIATTHDTCIMEIKNLKKEQIWFTEKLTDGSTELFSLDDFNKNQVRKGISFSKWYKDGRFRAVPAIDYSKLNIN